MWKKVPRQTTKRARDSFRRKIEPAEKMADGVTLNFRDYSSSRTGKSTNDFTGSAMLIA
jgi:hypothetical protein